MNIAKSRLESMLRELPDEVDTGEVMYRLYLLEKIEKGEADIREGKTLPHDSAMKNMTDKWRN